jgi:hypothetical protein
MEQDRYTSTVIPNGIGQLESRTIHDRQNTRWNRTTGRIPDGICQVNRREGIPYGIPDGTGQMVNRTDIASKWNSTGRMPYETGQQTRHYP